MDHIFARSKGKGDILAPLSYNTQSGSPGLRPEYVDGLKAFFDVLDSQRRGTVSYETLCARLCELPRPALPPNFLSSIGRVTPPDGQISFDRFLAAVKLSLKDQEINNNNIPMGSLYRVQSEGRLAQSSQQHQKRSPPMMGVNGLDQRRVIYASNPNLGGHSPNYENGTVMAQYGQVVMRPKKTTVRSQKEASSEHRLRHPLPPPGQPQKIAVPGRRPMSTNSYNSVASSGLENIVWRNSVMSSSNSDSTRRNTICEEDASPRIYSCKAL
ncbi:unnamed protein product, partial [Mesorhabditis belari]|uniref:EF-hand domain-containing protein n=1 Tax=Mesorhabditis belari TaxID=2138241 RepID=A0AAF3FKH2_9BILA